MRFAEFPFLRYAVFFIAGILVYSKLNHWPFYIIYIPLLTIYSLYTFIIFINYHNGQFRFRIAIPLLGYFQLFLMGVASCYLKDIHQDDKNLINYPNRINSYIALVLGHDEPKPNSNSNRVLLKKTFDGMTWQQTEGELLLYHRLLFKLSPGDLVWVWGSPQKINPASNPFEFDYRDFMLNQQITHQHFVSDQIQTLGKLNEFPIETFFMNLRAGIMEQIDRNFFNPKSNQIAKALLLGQKRSLDKETSEAYATAGAMHVLAVSGLHVGIIYGFFFLFFKPYRLVRPNRILYLTLLILLIWSYAMLTGMSASVMRAATMFSLMAMAQMNSRNPSIFNAIALSALILVVFDPFLLYSVGFQLSYAALLGIVIIQPILVGIWLPKNRFLEYAWQITTVGFAAQMATFPISGYYFHSFPVYFLLSNLIAIPGAFLIMSFGIPFMLFPSVPFLGTYLAWITEKLISLVNYLIFWIQEMPFSKVSDIYLSHCFVALYFLSLGLLLVLLLNPGKKLLYTLMMVLMGIGFLRLYSTIDEISKKEVVFYGLDNGIAIDIFYKGDLYVFEDLNDHDLNLKVNPHRNRIKSNSYWPLMAFQLDRNLLVCLPGNLGDIIIESDQIDFKHFEGMGYYSQWEEGKWKVKNFDKPIKLGGRAQKIVLN
ncbi:ComEC family competence protein [Cyclobacteriaceae bacterium YHN15]|nr:ComEC family competence protein [Cyclobacteriaceae bacterium YHN15]